MFSRILNTKLLIFLRKNYIQIVATANNRGIFNIMYLRYLQNNIRKIKYAERFRTYRLSFIKA